MPRLKRASVRRTEEGLQLNLPELDPARLPTVSLITLASDSRWCMGLAACCRKALTYPEDRLEWLIVDDEASTDRLWNVDFEGARYVRAEGDREQRLARAVALARHELLVFAEPDWYYPPDHVLAKARALLAHQEKAFVAVQRAGVCDLRTENAASAVCDLGRIPLGGVAVWKRRWARLRKPKYGLELPFLFAGIALAHDARLPAVSADESFLQEGLFGELEPVVREMHARVQSRK